MQTLRPLTQALGGFLFGYSVAAVRLLTIPILAGIPMAVAMEEGTVAEEAMRAAETVEGETESA